MTIKQELETFAAECCRYLIEGQPCPVWRGADLRGADLSDAYLRGANLRGADLRGADLRGADLSDAYLGGAELRGADLRGADLRGADLRDAYLGGADLSGADLSGADLRGANLTGADLRGANLTGALITEGTIITHAAGEDGGYHWHALRLQDGVIVLQYGCERHPLATWTARGPAYGAKHGHDEAHWAIGPAVAIAAAESLITKPASTDAKESQ